MAASKQAIATSKTGDRKFMYAFPVVWDVCHSIYMKEQIQIYIHEFITHKLVWNISRRFDCVAQSFTMVVAAHMTRGSRDRNWRRMRWILWSQLRAGDLLWMWRASQIFCGNHFSLTRILVSSSVTLTGRRGLFRDGRVEVFSICAFSEPATHSCLQGKQF